MEELELPFTMIGKTLGKAGGNEFNFGHVTLAVQVEMLSDTMRYT